MTRARDVANIDGVLTTTGDIYYASAAATPARLGIGSAGNVLTVASGIPSWAAPAGGGKVLQVVQGTTSTSKSNATSTYLDSNLTVDIQPSAATSKVLIFVMQPMAKNSSASNTALGWRLMRDSTSILEVGTNLLQTSSTLELNMVFPLNYYDTPNTTSLITYKTQIKSTNSTNLVIAQDGATSTIIALEIGA